MLDIVRNLVSSLFGKILLGLMILSFALWGMGDILSSGNSRLAAKIGSQKITLEEFYNKFQKSINEINQSTGKQISLEQARKEKIDMLVINELVYEKMVLDFSENSNIFLNDNVLKNIIQDLPQFKNNNDKFSETIYNNSILSNFSSEKEFLDELSFVFLNGLLYENFKSTHFINDKIINLLYEYEGETRDAEYFLLEDENINIDFSDEEISIFFADNINNYIIPENREVDYISINLDDYKQLVSISNKILTDYYNDNIDLFITNEKRTIDLVRFYNFNDALKFKQVWITDDEVKINDYKNIHSIKINRIDEITRENFDEHISGKIYKLKNKEISNPIEISDAGYYLVKVIETFPKKQETFESVKNTISEQITTVDAYDQFDEALNFADELLLNDYTLEDISHELGLETFRGLNQVIFKNVPVQEFALKLKKINLNESFYDKRIGYTSDLLLDDKSAFIYRISKINDAYTPELHQIRNSVIADFKTYKINKIAEDKASQFLINYQFKGYEEFKKYADKDSLDLIILNDIDRKFNENNFEIITINQLFKLKKDNLLKFKNRKNQHGIMYIKDIKSPKSRISENFYNDLSNNVEANFNSSIENTLGDKIIEETKYEIFLQNINNIF